MVAIDFLKIKLCLRVPLLQPMTPELSQKDERFKREKMFLPPTWETNDANHSDINRGSPILVIAAQALDAVGVKYLKL